MDTVERRAILDIAKAHSGTSNGDKDTISKLDRQEPILGKEVRYRTLAAILRFADELADDSHRASRIAERLEIIPEDSMLYHAYAKSLHSVMVKAEERRIALYFVFDKATATRTFKKKGHGCQIGEVFLLDEIFERTKKMHFEREYCMKFTHGLVEIDAIDVKIKVYNDEYDLDHPSMPTVVYRLEETGYPDVDGVQFSDLCPQIELTGEKLNVMLSEESTSEPSSARH